MHSPFQLLRLLPLPFAVRGLWRRIAHTRAVILGSATAPTVVLSAAKPARRGGNLAVGVAGPGFATQNRALRESAAFAVSWPL